MSLSLNHNHTSLHPKLLFRGRVRLKRIFDSVTYPPMPKQEQQQLTNDSPIAPTDKPFAPLVEELKIYS